MHYSGGGLGHDQRAAELAGQRKNLDRFGVLKPTKKSYHLTMLRKLDNTLEKTLKTDVCIIGAGPAGIVAALTLAKHGISSVLLEGGLLDGSGKAGRDAYKGEVVGLRYPLSASRLRWFGGTSNHWGGWCKALDSVDYTQRPDAPLPSWPINAEDLAPYQDKAVKWVQLASGNFENDFIMSDPASQLLFDAGPRFRTRMFRFSPPTNFGKVYRGDVEESELIDGIYNANVVSMTSAGDAVGTALAVSPEGDQLEVSADRFIMAMGGIENARLLMHLAKSEGGVFGSPSEYLGTCFMDHFGFSPGYLAASEGLKHFRHQQQKGEPILPAITAREDFQTEKNLPSICLMATPDSPMAELPPAYFTNPGILGEASNSNSRYRLQLMIEPTAHAASRITLSSNKDGFGVPRVVLDWQVLEQDYLDTERFLHEFALSVGTTGLGRMQRTSRFEGEYRQHLTGGMHHMGTTRMSDSPNFGVVDADCRVHGCRNLYMAGSSVFPRVGYTNPTQTLVALSERLADHLNNGVA
jgi:hypothetical protein